MEELKSQIRILEERLAKLEGRPSYEFSEELKDRVIKSTDTPTLTRTISLTGSAEDIVVPVNPTKTLTIAWKGTEYQVFVL